MRHVVWLVREHYDASITVDEIMLDEETRSLVQQKGVGGLAQLVQSLRGGAAVTRSAEKLSVGEVNGIVFEQQEKRSGDSFRVVVFSIPGHVFEATALAPGETKGDAFSAQQRFLETLQW